MTYEQKLTYTQQLPVGPNYSTITRDYSSITKTEQRFLANIASPLEAKLLQLSLSPAENELLNEGRFLYSQFKHKPYDHKNMHFYLTLASAGSNERMSVLEKRYPHSATLEERFYSGADLNLDASGSLVEQLTENRISMLVNGRLNSKLAGKLCNMEGKKGYDGLREVKACYTGLHKPKYVIGNAKLIHKICVDPEYCKQIIRNYDPNIIRSELIEGIPNFGTGSSDEEKYFNHELTATQAAALRHKVGVTYFENLKLALGVYDNFRANDTDSKLRLLRVMDKIKNSRSWDL